MKPLKSILRLNKKIPRINKNIHNMNKNDKGLDDAKYNTNYPANIYLFKVNNRSTRKRSEICSKLTIKTLDRRQASFDVFIVNLEHYFKSFSGVSIVYQEQVNVSWVRHLIIKVSKDFSFPNTFFSDLPHYRRS